jgi:ATP-dependent Clp protease ATP-binding subunit ClpA
VGRDAQQVELCHWLYCLAKAPGSLVRTRLIDALGRVPDRFTNILDAGLDLVKVKPAAPLIKLTAVTSSPEVMAMLEEAERLALDNKAPTVNEALLTLALLNTTSGILKDMLESWATEEGLQRFVTLLQSRLGPEIKELSRDALLDTQGRLKMTLFDTSGRKFCQRLREDLSSLGGKQVTTTHLLYTLLGQESGLLHRALAIRGIDVKNELHGLLSRELARPGRKRNQDFELKAETLFGGVIDVILQAARVARERGVEQISEADISKAFIHNSSKTLIQLFPRERPLDLQGLRDYLDTCEPDELEEEKPVLRFTIAEIEQRLNRRIRGQPQAIDRIIPWVKRLRFGLVREGRPAAVLLFLGPTGAGKTQLAKELARYVYGDEDMMVFIEMGQFQTRESMSMFIGAPPGYVGYGEGKLTNGLRDKPESVILFDEIEKAHIQVFDVLMRFADEGLISDPAGPIRDGRHCIIVMTTNAGQIWLQNDHLKVYDTARHPDQLAEVLARARADADLPKQLLGAARTELQQKGFRPEFIGRVDELITFLPFDKVTCREIMEDVLESEANKLLNLKGIETEVDPGALEVLTTKALLRCLTEGARCIPRIVNEYIINKAIDILTDLEEKQMPAHKLKVFEYNLGIEVEAQ